MPGKVGRPRATHCCRGHECTTENRRVNSSGCKICNIMLQRLRYRNDEAYREKMKAKSRNRHQCQAQSTLD